MNRNIFPRGMALPLMVILAVIACGTPVSATLPPEPEDTATVQIQPTSTTEIIQASTPAGLVSSCTVLIQGLNLRSGPGTAYRPAIRQLDANSAVTPLGFAPQGLVGGSWVYVQDPATQDKGWVSAGPQFISCNVDLASLPPVAFGTPQPYIPSTSQVSPGPGTPCGEGGIISESTGDVYDCAVVFLDGFPMQYIILKNGLEIGKADGVQNVAFSVVQNDNTIYSNTENTDPYCLFGGNGPCNYWVFEDYVYKWGAGGPVLETGVYILKIAPNLDDPSINLFWSADVTMTVPK